MVLRSCPIRRGWSTRPPILPNLPDSTKNFPGFITPARSRDVFSSRICLILSRSSASRKEWFHMPIEYGFPPASTSIRAIRSDLNASSVYPNVFPWSVVKKHSTRPFPSWRKTTSNNGSMSRFAQSLRAASMDSGSLLRGTTSSAPSMPGPNLRIFIGKKRSFQR